MTLKPHRTVNEYFHEALGAAMRNQHVEVSPQSELYLVNLLSEYARQPIGDQPLALELAEAVWVSPEERAQKLREVGDRSLYVSGFFAESLERKLVNVDYCVRIGGSAYRQLATLSLQRVRVEVFRELAAQFQALVEVLAEVSEAALSGPAGVVQLYERWRRTGSERLARRLRAFGVIPSPGGVH